jgi:histidine triad (HIT) family protein
MSRDPQCIFCRIANGELPSAKVLETAELLAFLDINPVNHGHILLIPKSHYPTLPDLSDDLAAIAGSLLPRLCRTVQAVVGVTDLNVIANTGRDAGQTVDHVHWHIIPRFRGDAVRWPWPHIPYDEGEMETMRSKLESALGAKSTGV